MTSHDLLIHATTLAMALLIIAMLLSVVRLVRKATLADRILALDTLNTLGIGFVGVIAIRTGITLYVDVALGLALVGFLSTVAFARYLLNRTAEQARES